MDRISGLMPQVGWSPLLTVAAPKTAPASTVEAAANAANTNGGLGANVDTQTSQDRAQTRYFLVQQPDGGVLGETLREPPPVCQRHSVASQKFVDGLDDPLWASAQVRIVHVQEPGRA